MDYPNNDIILSFSTNMKSCARCGQDHEEVHFKRLTFPIGDYDFWTSCPTNGEPILLKIDQTPRLNMAFLFPGYQWVPCVSKLPQNGEVVETKVEDANGTRNIQNLKRSNNLWFLPDGDMYIYYSPTHWREVQK